MNIESIEKLFDAKKTYERNIYGKWRSGETVSYEVLEASKRPNPANEENPFAAMFKLPIDDDGVDVEIHVNNVFFTVRVYSPKAVRTADPVPYIICMHPIQPKDYALNHGVGLVWLDTSMIAEDNFHHRGCFYELYPFGKEPETQTGELMAWSWGVSKVIDAMEGGLAAEFGFDNNKIIVTGVSRWGKATAVCGAFEERIYITMPVCSGAGGLALWNYQSEGKTYDLTHCGAASDYTYGENEPLSCLQSDAERGWFVDNFLKYQSYSDIPVEQYMLPLLAVSPSRKYLIVAAWTNEDWVNAPAMWECYRLASEKLQGTGLEARLHAHFHKEGHAVLEEDLEYLFTNLL